MGSIGGSVFVRNAIQYDYCIIEAIESLMPLCDKIAILDCQSDDGTTDMLTDFCENQEGLELHTGAVWECAPNYDRLRILANQAIEKLETDWHFMIQADEVLHEDSIGLVKHLIATVPERFDVIAVKRIHVWGDMDHQLRHDIPTERKPAGDCIFRIGRRDRRAFGDAESLLGFPYHPAGAQVDLFHYGFVRRNEVEKVIAMQSWFHGPGCQPDERVLAMRDAGGEFKPEVFFKPDELKRLSISHPEVAKQWVEDRRALWVK